jgi:hypothetical protein
MRLRFPIYPVVRVAALLGVVATAGACEPLSRRLPDPEGAGVGVEDPELEGPEVSEPGGGAGGSGAALPPCTGGSAGVGTQAGSGGAGSGGAGSGGAGSGGAGSGGAGSGGSTAGSDGALRQIVCGRWNADRQELSEGRWSGNVEHCDAGEISADGIDSALRMVNLYRWLAALPAVTTTPERNRLAQECALMQHANWKRSGLSHEPPRSWECYGEDGATGSMTSNLSTGPGVTSVGAYMLDLGNEDHLGHRRIILSNFLGPIGLGSTGPGGASCMQAIPGSGEAGKPWVAWPPPGLFPMDAYSYPPYSLDSTGWSIQSEAIDLSSAEVEVRANGSVVPVRVMPLQGRSGSTNAIRIVPRGWRARSGEKYSVSVTRTSTPIAYEFEIVDC